MKKAESSKKNGPKWEISFATHFFYGVHVLLFFGSLLLCRSCLHCREIWFEIQFFGTENRICIIDVLYDCAFEFLMNHWPMAFSASSKQIPFKKQSIPSGLITAMRMICSYKPINPLFHPQINKLPNLHSVIIPMTENSNEIFTILLNTNIISLMNKLT